MDIGEFIRKHAKFLIPLTIVVFIILGLLIVQSFYALIPESRKANLESIKAKKFSTIIDLLEYYECEFDTLERSSEKGYMVQLYAKLRLAPYDGLVSNESFYMALLNDIAIYYDYDNIILIDEEQDLKIKVTCENEKITKIIVNGIEDYFNKRKAEIAESAYTEIPLTDISVNSPIIIELMNNDWNANINFGTEDSTFKGYDVYFDEGIEVRKIQGKIYNIIFKRTYNQPVVNGLLVSDALTDVRKRLGKPAFEDNENDIIGYKSKDLYVFFSDNEISIYRIDNIDVTQLMSLIDKFNAGEIELLDFMNELTYMWPDYNEYEYTTSSVYLTYPLKGFEVKINYENDRGIYFYNNFKLAEEKILKYTNNEDFKALLQKDGVFIAETRRIIKNKELKEDVEIISESILSSNSYDIVLDKIEEDIIKVLFVSKDGTKVNRELNDSIDGYAWISDNHFVFSKTGKGIYCLNLITGKVQEILTGSSKFNITESGEGYIIYDNKEQRFQF